MLLTITTTAEPASDLGFLLHKHPGRVQTFNVSVGAAHVFYPEAGERRTTAALLLEVDPVGLVRGRQGPAGEGFALGQYVNDRPYAASSMLAVAIKEVFRTALTGRCASHQRLADSALPLELHVPALPSRGGADLARRFFGPLGWQVTAVAAALDPTMPGWGESRYLDVRLAGTVRLADALNHLYVLLPVLDDAKHYWVSTDEVDKLVRAGGDWLARHPEKELIIRRYLAHKRELTRDALARLAEVDDLEPEDLDNALDGHRIVEDADQPAPLSEQRRGAVLAAVRAAGARSVGDFGCGEGALVRDLLADRAIDRVVATDVSARALQIAARRLRLDSMSERDRERLRIFQSSLTYRDDRLAGSTCRRASAARATRAGPDRDFGDHVIRRQHAELRRSLRGLRKEGFRAVHVLDGEDEIAAATITRTRLFNDLRHQAGPFDVIGDVHGCAAELETLLGELGYRVERDELGRATGASHPDRRAIFVGDLVDRGPGTPGVLRLVMGMAGAGDAFCVAGNHENKLVRALRGRNVQVTHGLAESLAQLAAEPAEFRAEAERFMDGLVSHYVLDGGKLVVAHAGLVERYHGRASGRVREFCLYGQTTGETDEYGLPVRYPWAGEYRGRAMVLYGHTPVPEPEWVNNTMCLDTGCVFGGRLTALRYPEREVVSVPAGRVYYAPARPFPANPAATAGEAPPPAHREPEVLDIGDVTGRRVIETGYLRRIGVREENAAAALEVMSRFAIDPRWLLYLPPTMSPVATSARPDLLEHPDQAFDAYRAEGVDQVVCEEKHMGSRAVALVCRDLDAARARFGAPGSAPGAVWTRTGRPFFGQSRTAELVDRVRAAAEGAGLFDELGTSWLLLDAELLPWSAKAEQLLREQYAAVGAAARTALPAAVSALEQAAAAGLDVSGLLARTRSRAANADAFTAAYRRYCWDTDGLTGIRLAPFQLLASQGAAHHAKPHAWHLDVADRLVAADPGLFTATRRRYVATTDPAAVAEAARWWEELTGAGGEGMVVKPAANLTRGTRGLVQPGLKVRGREYLRIIYGPDYTEPGNLERLRQRGLGHKRSMAQREYALGLEALDRVARGEPLWRVHECVFAVLALESEPVDPRL